MVVACPVEAWRLQAAVQALIGTLEIGIITETKVGPAESGLLSHHAGDLPDV
jgi:hypothetical protein